jgi:UbiD family decarboxylase
MPFDTLRSFLIRLEEAGQLLRVHRLVYLEPDLGAAGRAVADLGERAPALLFTNIHGYRDAQVALNVHGSWSNHALMLDLPPGMGPREQFFELHRRWKNYPVTTERRTGTPPWRERTVTTNINLFDLFPFFRLNVTDGGPYIDKAAVVSRDPEAPDDFGRQNVGIYRLQVKGPDKLAVQAAPIHDLGRHMAAASRRGDRVLPVAICLANDPVLSLVASMPLKPHQSEYEMAGALQGRPYPVVTSPVHGLDVPWGSEAVIEAEILLDKREYEGPFGEFTGHTTGGRSLPTLRVNAVHTRNQPIFEHLYLGMPWTEIDYLMALNTCLPLYEQLREEFPEVRAVNAMYTHGLVDIISLEARTGGLGKLVAMRAITTPHGRSYCKFVILVDHTVDPFDLPQVMWALSTKVNPQHDLVVLPRMNMVPLDPSDDPPGLNSRVIIDATTPCPPDVRGGVGAQEITPWPESVKWRQLLSELIDERDSVGPPTQTVQEAERQEYTDGLQELIAGNLGPCPRCRCKRTEITAASPQTGCWQLYRCTTCWYIWRSTEPPTATDPECYPEAFRLDSEAISSPPELT